MKTFPVLSGPFRGTPIPVNWRNGKRKLLGIYEHELNEWWSEKLQANTVDVFYDVGAAEGYLTRGMAFRMRHSDSPRIVAFEPGMSQTGLDQVANDSCFSNVEFQLIPKQVGESETEDTTTLNTHVVTPVHSAIVKIDVEGAELEVLAGAGTLLAMPNCDWTVEIHGRDRIEPVRSVFEAAGKPCQIIAPRPHWLFGKESRPEWTGWLVT